MVGATITIGSDHPPPTSPVGMGSDAPPATGRPGSSPPSATATPPDRPGELEPSDLEAITASFLTFFGGIDSTVDQKLAVLEGAETYREMLEAASENAQFQQMSTEIREIMVGSDAECDRLAAGPGCAVVVHDVLVAGFPMAAAIVSPAVRGDGSWLVGWRAWCNIVEIGGETCPPPAEG